MHLNVIFIIASFIIWILGYLFYKLWKIELDYKYKFVITLFALIQLCIIISIFFVSKSFYLNKKRPAPIGKKGERGLRGDSGKNADCTNKCSNDLCYKIMLQHVTEEYNNWNFSSGYDKISEGQFINNKFIKNKINQICSSKKYKKNLSRDGAEKIDGYIKKTWSKWIQIILKYENGNKFLDSINLIDNDFDSLITEKDKKFSKFENQGTDGTPSKGLESPFDELKKYDLWYWGANPLTKPKIVNICSKDKKNDILEPELKIKESNDYYSAIWESRNSRQLKYQRYRRQIMCIPVGFFPVCFPICVKDGKHFVSGLQKGTSKVSAYKNKEFIDKSGSVFKPVGDIILPGNKFQQTKKNEPCVPKRDKNDKSSNCYRDKNGDDPFQKNILVSGNVKNPIGYKPMYISLRKYGYNKNNQGVQFWRPIPPNGYKCLGDVIVNNTNYSEPSTDLINCVPDKCLRQNNNIKKIYSTNNSPEDRCRSSQMCCRSEKSRTNLDTDFLKHFGEADVFVDKNNNFRVRDPKYQDNNGKFYEIIPSGQTGDSGQGSCLDTKISNKGDTNIKLNNGETNIKLNNGDTNIKLNKQIKTQNNYDTCNNIDLNDSDYHNNDNWIVSEKKNKKYSILNLYDS